MSQQSFNRFGWILTLSVLVCLALVGGWPASTPVEAYHIVNSQIFTSGNIDTTLGTSTFAKMPSPVFTFTKKSATSVVRITYQDTVSVKGAGIVVCGYQLRVDDKPGDPGNEDSTPYIIGSNLSTASLSSVGLFQKLAAGSHSISIYHRQVGATQCIRNSGGYHTTVIVEEIARL